MCDQPDGSDLRAYLLDQLAEFTGPDWEQEDDVTLVTFQRTQEERAPASEWQELAAFEVPSALGNERQATAQMDEAIAGLPLSETRVERLKTAVAEATMNAMEHGNAYDPAKVVHIRISSSAQALQVRIRDEGGQPVVLGEAVTPDLEAKLEGEQSPRGWGLFLIQNMVDEMNLHQDDDDHIIELVMRFSDKNGE
ncbi:MAG: ATP-binding protein [Alphaproteobacteria bacterium]